MKLPLRDGKLDDGYRYPPKHAKHFRLGAKPTGLDPYVNAERVYSHLQQVHEELCYRFPEKTFHLSARDRTIYDEVYAAAAIWYSDLYNHRNPAPGMLNNPTLQTLGYVHIQYRQRGSARPMFPLSNAAEIQSRTVYMHHTRTRLREDERLDSSHAMTENATHLGTHYR